MSDFAALIKEENLDTATLPKGIKDKIDLYTEGAADKSLTAEELAELDDEICDNIVDYLDTPPAKVDDKAAGTDDKTAPAADDGKGKEKPAAKTEGTAAYPTVVKPDTAPAAAPAAPQQKKSIGDKIFNRKKA